MQPGIPFTSDMKSVFNLKTATVKRVFLTEEIKSYAVKVWFSFRPHDTVKSYSVSKLCWATS